MDWDAAVSQFAVDEDDVRANTLPQPPCSIALTQDASVMVQGKDGRRHLTGAYWLLVPRWNVNKMLSYPAYNARVESVYAKPAFTGSAESIRATTPTSGYYEWKDHRPFYFHTPRDKLLSLAGLYPW